MAIEAALTAEFPDSIRYRRSLARYRTLFANFHLDSGRYGPAEEQTRAALAVHQQLASQFPAVPDYRAEVGYNLSTPGNCAREAGRVAESLSHLDRAVAQLRPLWESEQRNEYTRKALRESYRGRALAHERLRKVAEADADWGRALDLCRNDEADAVTVDRVRGKARAGRVCDALAEVAELRKRAGWAAPQMYDFACVYAVASAQNPEHAAAAVGLLRQAVAAGYNAPAHLAADADLDPIRGRDDFKRLVAELAAKTTPRPEQAASPRSAP